MIAIALLAQWSALELVDVKPYADYQHYYTWQSILERRPLAAFVVLAQAMVVVAVTWRARRGVQQTIGRWLSFGRVAVLACLVGFAAAVPTVSVERFAGEVVLAIAIALVSTINLIFAALALPAADVARLAAWAESRITVGSRGTEERPWDRYLPIVVAMWVALITIVVNTVVLERVPHIDDGVSNLFQAKYFAAGRLYLPAPPDAESFVLDLTVVREGKWFGYAFPGWPAVLALGVLAGIPWLVNPLLAAVQILAAHAWLRGRYDRATANIAVLVLAPSSWLIFTAAELMGHQLTGTLVMVALLAFDRATVSGPRWTAWSLVAGVSTGWLLLTRAVDGLLVGGILGLLALIDGRLMRAWKPVAVAGLTAGLVGSLILPYNRAVTGRATYPAHEVWADGRYGPGVDVVGFGPNVGIPIWRNLDPLPGHGPADVVLNLNKNVFMVNLDLFGWPSGSLLFLWLAICLRRWHYADLAMLAILGAYVAGYSVFWFSGGPDLVARYWYPLIVVFAALSVRGMQMVTAELRSRLGVEQAGSRIAVFVVAATAGAALVFVPWRSVTKHYRYRGLSSEVRELVQAQRFEHALVFVRDVNNRRDYAAAFTLNPPTLERPGNIFAFDAGPEHRAAVVSHFADRSVWVIGRPPNQPTAPIGIIAGPLPPGTVP